MLVLAFVEGGMLIRIKTLGKVRNGSLKRIFWVQIFQVLHAEWACKVYTLQYTTLLILLYTLTITLLYAALTITFLYATPTMTLLYTPL